LENNPVFSARTSGTLKQLFYGRILRAGQWAIEPAERCITDSRREKVPIRGEIDSGEPVSDWELLAEGKRRFLVLQCDSTKLEVPEQIVDYVITDPPYYDNVQYSDLSNFFRVWLRVFLPQEADWRYDPLASAVSEGGVPGGSKYGEVLGEIWKMCRQALKKGDGRLIFTFHHWSHKAWAELTLSLKKAGFALVNCYVVFSENPTSVHIKGLRSLKHDTILVLRSSAGDGEFRKWPKPAQIDATDSYTFCRDCGMALGWFLISDVEEEHIRSEWKRLLEGVNNGKDKASC
jgi:putative DNA methylase